MQFVVAAETQRPTRLFLASDATAFVAAEAVAGIAAAAEASAEGHGPLLVSPLLSRRVQGSHHLVEVLAQLRQLLGDLAERRHGGRGACAQPGVIGLDASDFLL